MNGEVEMFIDLYLRGFIDAAANRLSWELPERKRSMNLPTAAAILGVVGMDCEHSEDTPWDDNPGGCIIFWSRNGN